MEMAYQSESLAEDEREGDVRLSGMEQLTLFGGEENQPLAARLRPRTLEEFVGQTHLWGKGRCSDG